MPTLVKMFSITLMYNVYIIALKLLIEMLISCIFVNLNREIFLKISLKIEPNNNSRKQQIQKEKKKAGV